jgi:hypothetical protein
MSRPGVSCAPGGPRSATAGPLLASTATQGLVRDRNCARLGRHEQTTPQTCQRRLDRRDRAASGGARLSCRSACSFGTGPMARPGPVLSQLRNSPSCWVHMGDGQSRKGNHRIQVGSRWNLAHSVGRPVPTGVCAPSFAGLGQATQPRTTPEVPWNPPSSYTSARARCAPGYLSRVPGRVVVARGFAKPLPADGLLVRCRTAGPLDVFD